VPVAEAGRRAATGLTALGLRAELTEMGAGRDPTAWFCRLSGRGTGPYSSGMGKGRPAQARVGALFEAVEHHLTGPAGFDPAAVEPAGPAVIAAGLPREDPCALVMAGMPGRRMACLRYRPLGGGPERPVPLFLSAPWYVETGAARLRALVADDCDYTQLMRYSCNSGSAAGVTAAEALLHALNETIERDALSLLLVRTFLGRRTSRLRLIDPGTLPYELARAYATAAELAGSPVRLLDITSDLAVPTVLAYTAPTARQPHRRGAGTSLSPAHAAWRALAELVQTTLGERLRSSGTRGEPAGPAAHPALRACGRFDLTGALREARVIPFPQAGAVTGASAGQLWGMAGTPEGRLWGMAGTSAGQLAGMTGAPAVQLRQVAGMLAARGHHVYHRTVAALPGEVTVVHVIVPALERFMLITDGNLVVPGRRGLAATTKPSFP